MTTTEATPLQRRVEQLRSTLLKQEPESLAIRTKTAFHPPDEGEAKFVFPYWNDEVILPIADYIARDPDTGTPLNILDQAMIAYYFHETKGPTDPRGWISFSELPDGQFYATAYRGYTSDKIRGHFQRNYEDFDQTAKHIGGQPVPFASCAYRVQILPQVAALVACWKGDSELPPSYQVLFQDNVPDHLPTDACAILGSMITSKLIKARNRLAAAKPGGGKENSQGQRV